MSNFFIWLLFAFAITGIILALILWRRGKLTRDRALLVSLGTSLGAMALIVFGTRVSTFVLPEKLVPVDLGIVLTQTGWTVLGVLLGVALAGLLVWLSL